MRVKITGSQGECVTSLITGLRASQLGIGHGLNAIPRRTASAAI